MALICLTRVRLELRMYDIIDPHFPSTQNLRNFAEEFDDGNSILFFLNKHSGRAFTAGEYCQIQKWFENQKAVNTTILSAFGPSDVLEAKNEDGRLVYRHRLNLDCNHLPVSQTAAAVDFGVFKGTPWAKNAVSVDGRDFALEFTFQNAAADNSTDESLFNPHWITRLFESFKVAVAIPNPDIEVHIGGRSSFQWFQIRALVKDLWVNGLISLLIFLSFRLFFGTYRSGLVFLGTVLFSAILTFGTMALFGFPIDTLSNALFPMICIAGLEDFIFVSKSRQESNGAGKRNWRIHFKKFVIPGFFTSLTTVAGFLSFTFSDLSIIRRFGACAAFAAFVEWGVTFLVLPSFLEVTRMGLEFIESPHPLAQKAVTSLSALKIPKTVAYVAVVAAIASCFSWRSLVFDMSPREYFPKTHPLHQTYDYTRLTRGWEAILNVVFQNEHDRKDNELILDQIKKTPNVAGADDPYYFRDETAQGLPPLMAAEEKRQLRLSPDYRRFFSPWGRARAQIYIKDFDLRALDKTLATLRTLCGERCSVVGEGVVFSEYSQKVINTLFTSFGSCLFLTAAIILSLIWTLRRSLKGALTVFASLFWAPLILIGVLAVFKIPVNYFNCMFATILVGLTGDNFIQYLFSARNKSLSSGVNGRGQSSVILGLMTMATSLCFLGMTPLPLKNLGILLFLGFLASLVGDLWILKGLLT